MRAFLAAVVVALVVSAMSRADLLPPGTKNIPVEHKIESEKEYPDWVFFIVRGLGGVKKVTLSPKSAIVVPGSSGGGGSSPKTGTEGEGARCPIGPASWWRSPPSESRSTRPRRN